MTNREVEDRLAECGRIMVCIGGEFRQAIEKAARKWAESR